MDDDVFDKLAGRTKEIMSYERGQADPCLDEIILVWKKYHGQGLSPYRFATMLLELSMGTMILMDDLEEAEAFAKYVRDGGEQMRKIISEEWPPPSQFLWQWDPKAKG